MKSKNKPPRVVETKRTNKLLDYIRKSYLLPTDRELAKFLMTSSPVISRIRNGDIYPPPFLILNIYDKTNLSIDEIRRMARENK